jgi:hypothetical protein
MPKPILCLSEVLRQYLEGFRPCFSKRQWKYFATILLGLVECEERKTMTGMKRCVAEGVSLSGLSRFMSKWSWSAEAVAARWMERFWERQAGTVQAEHERRKVKQPKSIGRPKATVVTGYLMFDDSVHAKPKGRKICGSGLALLQRWSLSVHGVVCAVGSALSVADADVSPESGLSAGRRCL